MKNGFVIFLAAFAVLLTSWGVFVLKPQLQLGGAEQVAVLNSSDIYPTQPSRRGEPRSANLSRKRLCRVPHRAGAADWRGL